jgi:hypothetical protein
MVTAAVAERSDRGRTVAAGLALACVAVVIYLACPVVQITDHKYLMLASDALATRGTLRLDGVALEPGVELSPGAEARSPDYRVEVARGHYYHLFPVGTAIVAAPAAAIARALGWPAVDELGRYEPRAERRLNRVLAALLSGGLAAPFYGMARTRLRPAASVALVAAAMLGSQLASTASRGLWSHDGALVCVALALWLWVRAERDQRRPNGWAIGGLLAWAYLFRPTATLSAVALVALIGTRARSTRVLAAAGAGAALWLVPFAAWSLATRGTIVPPYYEASRLALAGLPLGLAGNLISPSRGTLVFVPWVAWLYVVAWRRRAELGDPRLVAASAALTMGHLLAVGAFPQWYGGHCYGARLTTELVPWWFAAAVVVVPVAARAGRGVRAAGLATLAVAAVLNLVGAVSEASWRWNARDGGIDAHRERLWSLADAQFMAPLRADREVRP